MILDEKDIDFSNITWKAFEELCFDLLLKYHFHSLVWRQGGHDKGRDIEAYFTVTNPIIVDYKEKWFVECKHHKGGLNVADISDKIDWAVAESADHLLIITSSYLTQTTRDWLVARTLRLPFHVHILNGKLLKQRLLALPDIVIKYFFSDKAIVSEMLKLWVLYDILPDAKSFYTTVVKTELRKLKVEHLIFLVYCNHSLSDELDRYCQEEELVELNDRIFIDAIAPNVSSTRFSNKLLKSLHIQPDFLGRSSIIYKDSDRRIFLLRERYKGKFLELYLKKESQKLDFGASLSSIKL